MSNNQSNGGPEVVIGLSEDDAKFLAAHLDEQVTAALEGMMLLHANRDTPRSTFEQIVPIMDRMKRIRTAVKTGLREDR